MLFASLQRQHKGPLAAIILRHADDASRHLADKFLRAAHIAHIRASPLHGDTQRLPIADSDVSPPLTRSFQHAQVGSDAVYYEQCFMSVAGLGKSRQVFYDTIDVGLLYQYASHTAVSQLCFEFLS